MTAQRSPATATILAFPDTRVFAAIIDGHGEVHDLSRHFAVEKVNGHFTASLRDCFFIMGQGSDEEICVSPFAKGKQLFEATNALIAFVAERARLYPIENLRQRNSRMMNAETRNTLSGYGHYNS